MTDKQQNNTTVDVQTLTKEIHAGIQQAEQMDMQNTPAPSAAENDLYEILKIANENYSVDAPSGGGLKGLLRLRLFALLSTPFQTITQFHIQTLRALNKITKVLDGTHDDLSSELLIKNKNRMDLVELLTNRVSELEERIGQLEEKLSCGKDSAS